MRPPISLKSSPRRGANAKNNGTPKSAFTGIAWFRKARKWQSHVLLGKKLKILGSFANMEEAARAYDEAAGPLGRPVNFPEPGQEQAVKLDARAMVSRYTGIRWSPPIEMWVAQHRDKKQVKQLGVFTSEVDAARKYDEAVAPLGQPVNFPGPGQRQAVKRGACDIVSRYSGVHMNARANMWRALISVQGAVQRLGLFVSQAEAARAYDAVAGPLGMPVNFPGPGQVQAVKQVAPGAVRGPVPPAMVSERGA